MSLTTPTFSRNGASPPESGRELPVLFQAASIGEQDSGQKSVIVQAYRSTKIAPTAALAAGARRCAVWRVAGVLWQVESKKTRKAGAVRGRSWCAIRRTTVGCARIARRAASSAKATGDGDVLETCPLGKFNDLRRLTCPLRKNATNFEPAQEWTCETRHECNTREGEACPTEPAEPPPKAYKNFRRLCVKPPLVRSARLPSNLPKTRATNVRSRRFASGVSRQVARNSSAGTAAIRSTYSG